MRWRSSATAVLAAFACLLAACATSASGATVAPPTSAAGPTVRETFVPDYFAPAFNANVTITEEEVSPPTLFLPAGRLVRLAIKSRTPDERHYRIAGMPVTEVRWLMVPEYTVFELEQMTPEEQEAIGFDPNKTDADHLLHHLQATMMPMRDASPGGIQPLPGEVHGWIDGHGTELITFYPLTTGRYDVDDPMHPGAPIASVVVFAPPADDAD